MPAESKHAWPLRRIAEPLLLGLASLLFVVLTRYHRQQICDDAFIAFRYANHVAAGLGLVWNPAEKVEGFSSPLWLGLLVLGKVAGASLPTYAGSLGILFSALSLVIVHRFTLELSQSRLASAVAFTCSSLVYPLYYWAPAGLETALFTALITAGAWSLVMKSSWCWALAASLIGVARPEGPLLACALIGLAWLSKGRSILRLKFIGLALSPMLLWFVFRRSYFGEWLPNTYYAKATGEFLSRLTMGAIYALWGLIALVVGAATVWFPGTRDRKTLSVVLFLTLALTLVIAAGGDWMWHGRMLVPVLPSLMVLAATGIAHTESPRRLALVLACLFAGSAFVPSAAVLASAFSGGRLPETAYQEGTMVSASVEVAGFIASKIPADALVAVNHAGALPHALPNPVLDMAGLSDHHIAHEVQGRLHHKFDPAYVLARKPRLIVLNSRVRPGTAGTWYHTGYWIGETALVMQPEFKAAYRPINRFWEWQWKGGARNYILIYERVLPVRTAPEPVTRD